MSIANVRIVNAGGSQVVPTLKFLGEAAATAMYAGEPVKAKVDGSKYAIPLAD